MSTGIYLFLEQSLGFDEEWHDDWDGLWEGVRQTKSLVVNPSSVQAAFQPFMKDLAQHVHQNIAKYDAQLVAMYQAIDQQPILSDYLVCSLELPHSARLQAIDLIVKISQYHKIVVILDEPKYSVVFYPNGTIFSNLTPVECWREAAVTGTEVPKPFAKTIAQFKKIAQPLVNELMKKHGFEIGNLPFFKEEVVGYLREVELGSQYISLRYDKTNFSGKFEICIYIYINNTLATQIYNKFKFLSRKYSLSISSESLLNFNGNHVHYKQWLIGSIDELHQVLALYEARLFAPILDIAKDIKGMDALINGTVNDEVRDMMQYSFFGPFCLIFARLAGNPDFDGLVEQLRIAPHLRDWQANEEFKESEFPKLVNYLREEVKPIV